MWVILIYNILYILDFYLIAIEFLSDKNLTYFIVLTVLGFNIKLQILHWRWDFFTHIFDFEDQDFLLNYIILKIRVELIIFPTQKECFSF